AVGDSLGTDVPGAAQRQSHAVWTVAVRHRFGGRGLARPGDRVAGPDAPARRDDARARHEHDGAVARGAPHPEAQEFVARWARSVDQRLRAVLAATLEQCRAEGLFEGELPAITLERPKKAEHGDFATNLALALAKRARKNPREVAELVRTRLCDPDGLVAAAE